MDLTSLGDFNAVALHGGFGPASRALDRPKATLSRRVAELEESLGVRLIERGSRRLRLTDEGLALHERTRGLMAEIQEAGEAIASSAPVARGLSRTRGQEPHQPLLRRPRHPEVDGRERQVVPGVLQHVVR